MSTPSPEKRRAEWVLLIGVTGILVLSVLWHPLDDGGFILCLFRRSTGLPCLGCGLTRSFCAMAKGEVARASQFHLLGPGLYLIACIYWLRGIAAVAMRDEMVARFDATVMRWKLPYVVIALLFGAWIFRLWTVAHTG